MKRLIYILASLAIMMTACSDPSLIEGDNDINPDKTPIPENGFRLFNTMSRADVTDIESEVGETRITMAHIYYRTSPTEDWTLWAVVGEPNYTTDFSSLGKIDIQKFIRTSYKENGRQRFDWTGIIPATKLQELRNHYNTYAADWTDKNQEFIRVVAFANYKDRLYLALNAKKNADGTFSPFRQACISHSNMAWSDRPGSYAGWNNAYGESYYPGCEQEFTYNPNGELPQKVWYYTNIKGDPSSQPIFSPNYFNSFIHGMMAQPAKSHEGETTSSDKLRFEAYNPFLHSLLPERRMIYQGALTAQQFADRNLKLGEIRIERVLAKFDIYVRLKPNKYNSENPGINDTPAEYGWWLTRLVVNQLPDYVRFDGITPTYTPSLTTEIPNILKNIYSNETYEKIKNSNGTELYHKNDISNDINNSKRTWSLSITNWDYPYSPAAGPDYAFARDEKNFYSTAIFLRDMGLVPDPNNNHHNNTNKWEFDYSYVYAFADESILYRGYRPVYSNGLRSGWKQRYDYNIGQYDSYHFNEAGKPYRDKWVTKNVTKDEDYVNIATFYCPPYDPSKNSSRGNRTQPYIQLEAQTAPLRSNSYEYQWCYWNENYTDVLLYWTQPGWTSNDLKSLSEKPDFQAKRKFYARPILPLVPNGPGSNSCGEIKAGYNYKIYLDIGFEDEVSIQVRTIDFDGKVQHITYGTDRVEDIVTPTTGHKPAPRP